MRILVAWAALAAGLPSALGGTIRLWGHAVVTGDAVRLDDVAELRGFDESTARRIGATIVTEAPPPGGSRVIEMGLLRAALSVSQVNPATSTIRGASRCELTRPAVLEQTQASPCPKPRPGVGLGATSKIDATSVAGGTAMDAPRTLRRAVVDFFNDAARRYQARAEVAFESVSEQLLELAGPTYTFRVRNASRQLIGLLPVEIDVLAGDRIVQTVPLSVRITVFRDTIVAQRAINQDATIQSADVGLVPMSLTRMDDLPVNDLGQVVGQRAKRFLAAGAVVDAGSLASVPLVLRGQLVTLVSEVGGVRVVTAGKAAEDGKLGEVIRVRSTDRKQAEFDAVVTGPGQVRVAQEASASLDARPAGEKS